MNRRAFLLILLWLLNFYSVTAQENNQSNKSNDSINPEKTVDDSLDENAVLKTAEIENSERFYVIKINLKILDNEKNKLADSKWELETLSGKSVAVQLKGNNLKINADMTPYFVDKKSILLLTRANIKLKPSDSDDSKFFSTVNSLPIKLGEKALFFPLGLLDEKMENISSCVLEIEVQPYDNVVNKNGSENEKLGEEIKKD